MAAPDRRGAPALLLVPTALEMRELVRLGGFGTGIALTATCGFGPIAAAATTAALLANLRPARVVLVGIAGSYDADAHPLERAVACSAVAIDGLETAGFQQAPGIGARIELASKGDAALLLTVMAPSSTPGEAAGRRERFPDAALEDMEGFGVALACTLARVPLAIVRGVSNVAGDRDRGRWKVRGALAAARAVAAGILER
jgi:futalosine hydrolase